jgi:hypothetical protein
MLQVIMTSIREPKSPQQVHSADEKLDLNLDKAGVKHVCKENSDACG